MLSLILMNSKLYVGNLASNITEADLHQMFSRVGAVTQVNLMLDPATQQSRGHAFVTMATPELAAAALNDLHCRSLGGRYITVTEARPPQQAKGMMSEGFDLGAKTSLNPGFRPEKSRRRSLHHSRRSGRRR
jgi:cold-inducible RNA-binding protein